MTNTTSSQNRRLGDTTAGDGADAFSLAELFAMAWHNKIFVVAGLGAGLGIGLLAAEQRQAEYTSRAELVVDVRELSISGRQLTPPAQSAILSTLVNTEMNILQSDQILQSVVAGNNLQDDPEFTATGGLGVSIREWIGLDLPPMENADLTARSRLRLIRPNSPSSPTS